MRPGGCNNVLFSTLCFPGFGSWYHTDPEAGIGFSECQKGSKGSLEFCEQYEKRI